MEGWGFTISHANNGCIERDKEDKHMYNTHTQLDIGLKTNLLSILLLLNLLLQKNSTCI